MNAKQEALDQLYCDECGKRDRDSRPNRSEPARREGREGHHEEADQSGGANGSVDRVRVGTVHEQAHRESHWDNDEVVTDETDEGVEGVMKEVRPGDGRGKAGEHTGEPEMLQRLPTSGIDDDGSEKKSPEQAQADDQVVGAGTELVLGRGAAVVDGGKSGVRSHGINATAIGHGSGPVIAPVASGRWC